MASMLIRSLAERLLEDPPYRDPQTKLVRQAERLYFILQAINANEIGSDRGRDEFRRLMRIVQRAHNRYLRRSVNLRCAGLDAPCGRPASHYHRDLSGKSVALCSSCHATLTAIEFAS